jgi:hypothetical protein
VAKQIEAAHRVRLAKGDAGIFERPAAPVFKEFAPRFTNAIETLCANKPQTVDFYKRKLRALLKYEPIASTPLDLIDEAAIQAFKQNRSRHVSKHRSFCRRLRSTANWLHCGACCAWRRNGRCLTACRGFACSAASRAANSC